MSLKMIFKPKIVSFKDGTYGLRFRTGLFSFEYLDLKHPIQKHIIGSIYFKDCKGTLEEVEAACETLSDIGTPVYVFKYDL